MAKLFPKRKEWVELFNQLVKYSGEDDNPPSYADSEVNWKRNRCWEQTVIWAKQHDAYHLIQNMKEDDFYATTPFKSADKLPEDFSGEIGKLLAAIINEKSWNKKKRELVTDLISLLKSKDYFGFTGHGPTYRISTVGSSFIYNVPMTKQGNLKRYKGKTVRVICVGSGSHTNRYYMIGLYEP